MVKDFKAPPFLGHPFPGSVFGMFLKMGHKYTESSLVPRPLETIHIRIFIGDFVEFLIENCAPVHISYDHDNIDCLINFFST
jgi:hypothetical protein